MTGRWQSCRVRVQGYDRSREGLRAHGKRTVKPCVCSWKTGRLHVWPEHQSLHRLQATDCYSQEGTGLSHIVNSCPLTKFDGGLLRLHEADEAAVHWLTIYGSKHKILGSAPSVSNVCYTAVAHRDGLSPRLLINSRRHAIVESFPTHSGRDSVYGRRGTSYG